MASQPRHIAQSLDYSHLPQVTLSDVRERVRGGEALSIGIVQQMPAIYSGRKDALHRMREFFLEDIIVRDGTADAARTETPSPSPFPEQSDAILARCAAHITAIRNRSDALLASTNALIDPTLYYIERMAGEHVRHALVQQLVEIEKQCVHLRGVYMYLFCDAYIHDTFFSEEHYRSMKEDVDAAFARQEEILIALQQHP